ncbi:hypothetical protein [Methanobrevibacter sp.]|uniref:hypothetical protein n=1 Tax=Methanobrevibacter sp. TaxID=66852 RepID=UPI00388D2F70
MQKIHKILAIIVISIMVLAGAFVLFTKNTPSGNGPSYNATALNQKLSINMNNWSYDSENDIYYQIGLVYCMNPKDPKYESCGIYVPGKYFNATKNPNGTCTCTANDSNKIQIRISFFNFYY